MAQGNALNREVAANYLRRANYALQDIDSAAKAIIAQVDKIIIWCSNNGCSG